MTNLLRDSQVREATALMNAGRAQEALAAFERVVAQWPALPNAWYNVALLRRRLGRFHDALAAYQAALDHAIAEPEEVHLNRGVIYADELRDDESAERELRQALRLNPRYLPALLNLGNLHEDRGRRADAAIAYDQALSIDPQAFEALARRANIGQAQGPDDLIIAKLRAAISHPRANAAEKASLGFALGKTLDEAGAFDDSWTAYVAANQASRQSAPRGVLYDRAAQERRTDALIAAFPARVDGAPPPRKAPIFILGMFRSGSTLTEQVLAAHSRVTAGGELNILPRLVREKLPGFPRPLAPDEAARAGALYAGALNALFPNADIVTDKRPANHVYVGLIKRMFPDAKIIHTTRHALDNCLSVYFLHLDHGMAYALDLRDCGHQYREQRRLMAHWAALYGEDIHTFDYDAFVRDPRAETERLLKFCGLDWDEACLAFHEQQSSVKTASVWQVRQPVYQRASGRWRNYARHIAPLADDLADLIAPEESVG